MKYTLICTFEVDGATYTEAIFVDDTNGAVRIPDGATVVYVITHETVE